VISRFCQVPILGLTTLSLCTPICNRKSLILQAPDLNVQIQGCLEPSEYIRKPSGVRKSKYICTGNK